MERKNSRQNRESNLDTLLIFQNEGDMTLTERILSRENINATRFQIPEGFKGVNITALQFPSTSKEEVYEALRVHTIVIGGIYSYNPSKVQKLERKIVIPGKGEVSSPYLERIDINKVLSCFADSQKVRVTARDSTDISEIMPYLNTLIPKATYTHEAKTLTFTEETRVITIYANKIEMGKVRDIEDAISVLAWLRDIINLAYENRDYIKPTTERRVKINALELYKYLPGTNCKECGEQHCLALAVKVLMEEQKIANCRPLQTAEYQEKGKYLFRILEGMGYEVPHEK